jgi:sulfatase modifying factor 1
MSSHIKAGAPKATSKQLASQTRRSAWFAYSAVATLVAVVIGGLFAWSYFFPPGSLDLDVRRPPKLNAATPPGPAPQGMVWVPGGEFYMGIDEDIVPDGDDYFHDARFVHMTYVNGFWMDQHEVTNEQFKEFVDATGYLTVAEKQPTAEEFPDADPKQLVPFSLVFAKPAQRVLDVHRAHRFHAWWKLVPGASWRRPEGPGSNIDDMAKHPVVHVCWDDAVAYCKWAGKRLPTEAEWEFAARGGLDRNKFAWGNDVKPGGRAMCNFWQGDFPNDNTKEDGYVGLAPVGQYPANGYGLFDMAGNAWEWCSDWYVQDYYRRADTRNPKGPANSFDASEPGTPKRVQRGGSFLCADNYCQRYLPGARGKCEPSSSQNHTGFRCVMTANQKP